MTLKRLWKDKYEKKAKLSKLIETNHNANEEKEYLIKVKYIGLVRKYAKINENEYIIVKYNLLLPIILGILFLALLFGTYIFQQDEKKVIPLSGQDIEEYNPSFNKEQEMIEVPGLSNRYIVDANNREIYLVNLEGNTVLFQYTISVDEEVIYQSGYIPENKMEKADLYSLLSAGEYDITVMISTIDEDTYTECNSAKQKTTVEVRK